MDELTPVQSPDSTSTNNSDTIPHEPKISLKGKEPLIEGLEDTEASASQCIICLSHLPEEEPEEANVSSEEVAVLVPCSHALHNACLAPWIERANSCPMCRASFNTVRVSRFLTGETALLVLLLIKTSTNCHLEMQGQSLQHTKSRIAKQNA